MRVLLVNKFLERRGGVETYVLELGRMLAEAGHEVQYFGMDGPEREVGNDWGIYAPRIELGGRQGLGRFADIARTIRSQENHDLMAGLLEKFQPDIVHLNNIHYHLTPSVLEAAAGYKATAEKPVGIVMTQHDYHLVVPCDGCLNNRTYEMCEKCLDGRYLRCTRRGCGRGGRAKSVVGTLESMYWHRRGAYRHIDVCICPSAYMQARFEKVPEFAGRTTHIPNFTNLKRLTKPVEKEGYVLYYGAYNRDKGVATLLDVARRHPEIEFRFAGRGPYSDQMKDISNVRDLGFNSGERLREIVARASLVVVPSECMENSPFAVIEAQCLGTPILAARVGGIPELMEDGVTGQLFSFRNRDDLERRLVKLVADPALLAQYSENCMRYEPMSPQRYLALLEGAYRHAMQRDPEEALT